MMGVKKMGKRKIKLTRNWSLKFESKQMVKMALFYLGLTQEKVKKATRVFYNMWWLELH